MSRRTRGVRNEDCYSQAGQLGSIRQSYSVETIETDPESVVCEQNDSIDSKRLEQAIEFRRLDRLRSVSGENLKSMHESRRRIQHLELEITYLSAYKKLPRRNDDVLLDEPITLPGCQALTVGDFRQISIDIDYLQATEQVNVNGLSCKLDKDSSGAFSPIWLLPLNPASLDGLRQNRDGDGKGPASISQQRFSKSRNELSQYIGIGSTARAFPINSHLLNDDEPFTSYTTNESKRTRGTVSEAQPSYIQDLARFEDPKDFVNKSKMVNSAPLQIASKASTEREDLLMTLVERFQDIMDKRKVQHVQLDQRTWGKSYKPRSVGSSLGTLESSPLRLLLKQYNLLDAICNLSVTVINTSIDIVDAIPPFRPLVESLNWMTESTPRPWLALRKSIKDFHTDVLHGFLNILVRAVEYTYQILRQMSVKPATSSKERALLDKSHLDHIKVRGYVLLNLQAATTKFIYYLSSSHGGVAPLGYLAPSWQLLKSRTGGVRFGLERALAKDRDIQDSNTIKTQRNANQHIQKMGKTLSRGRRTRILAFEHMNGIVFPHYHLLTNALEVVSAVRFLGSLEYLLPSSDQGFRSNALHRQRTKISLSRFGAKLPLSILLLRKVNLVACGNPSTFILSNIYSSIKKLLNCSIQITLPLEVHWKSNALQKSTEGSTLLLRPFPGLWECRKGLILWRTSDGLELPLLPAKEFSLSAIRGTVLDELIKIHLYKDPKWLNPLQACLIQSPETLLFINAPRIFWDLCKYLLKLTELFVFLELTVSPYYLRLCRHATVHIFRVLHRLSNPLKPNEELYLSRRVSLHFVFLVLVIDCLYMGLDPFLIAKSSSAEFFQQFVRFSNSQKTPASTSLAGPTDIIGCRFAAEGSLTNSPEQIPHRKDPGFVERAGWNLSRTLQALGFSAPAVKPGKTRIKWTCRCGCKMYDDYREVRPGAAKEFEGYLKGTIRQKPSHKQDEHTKSAKAVDHRYPASESEHKTSTLSSISTPNSSQAYDPRPDYNQSVSTTIQCDPESRWLLVCGQAKKCPTSLSQMDVCSIASDRELFSQLKRSYSSLRGKWSSLLSLRTIKSIRFVQFELHFKDFVDIRKVPDMPPETRKDEYQYQPCDLIPPVGENLMAHLFHHPEDATAISVTCLRTPKKRKARLAVCPQMGTNVGWGIHLVEGWAMTRVWLLALSTFVFGSLVFGICWSIFKHDIQGAFGVSTYIIALLALAMGTVQAYFA